jgi:hypothetical protein
MLKLKAFIYRFSNIFGLRIYLADKEEQAFIDTQDLSSGLAEGTLRGCWQAQHGFTTVWTSRLKGFRKFKLRTFHAFGVSEFNFYCFSYSIADKDGKPHGVVWYTACTSYGNFRLFPIGYCK